MARRTISSIDDLYSHLNLTAKSGEVFPKYPKITVKHIGEDGNAIAIVGRTIQAMLTYGLDNAQIDEYYQDALSDNYDHVLVTTLKYVRVR